MILNTHPSNRKDMVKAISELTGHAAVYKFMPTYAYEIGPIIVNKDGTITCEDVNAIEQIQSMLLERGWLDSLPPVVQAIAGEADSETACAATEETEAQTDSERHMEMSMPLRGWLPVHMTNLVRLMYSRQRLINRMMQSDMLFISDGFAQSVTDEPIEGYEDFEARMKAAIASGDVRGISYHEGKFCLHTPSSQEDPTRWMAYNDLLSGILKLAQEAKHIHMKPNDDPECEKYHANTWLMRMGFAGTRYKDTRRILLRHLNGFAAFRSADAMQRHRDKYAQMRKQFKEAQHDARVV